MVDSVSHDITVPALLLPGLLKTGLDFDVDTIEVLAKHGIDVQTLPMDTGRIPVDRFNDVLLDMVAATENPTLGLSYSHHFDYDYIPEINAYLMSAENLLDCMLAFKWIVALFDSFVNAYFESDHDSFSIRVEFAQGTPEAVGRFFVECSFCIASTYSYQNTAGDFQIKRIGFAHSDKSSIPIYQNVFRCPISVDEDYYYIKMDLAGLKTPLKRHSVAMNALAKYQVEQRIAQLTGDKTLVQKLFSLLSHHPYLMAQGIDECAKCLYLSPRTLQRKLSQSGTNYREVSDSVKQQLAKKLLAGNTSLEQISDLLCFADRRSFTRAFQRWEGLSPSAYRKELGSVELS